MLSLSVKSFCFLVISFLSLNIFAQENKQYDVDQYKKDRDAFMKEYVNKACESTYASRQDGEYLNCVQAANESGMSEFLRTYEQQLPPANFEVETTDKGRAKTKTTDGQQQVGADDKKPPTEDKEKKTAATDDMGKKEADLNEQNLKSDIDNQYEADMATCKKTRQTAATCCQNPIKCLSGSQMASDGLSLATAIGSQVGQGLMMNAGMNKDSAGMQSICNALKLGSLGTSATNVGLAGVCSQSHNSCEDTCEAMAQKWENEIKPKTTSSKNSASLAKVNRAINEFRRFKNDCGTLANQATQMMAQGVSTGLSSQLFSECSKLTAQSTGFENLNLNRGVDCNSDAYKNTAYCVNCTTNPTNPYCIQQSSAGSGSTVGTISTRSVASGTGNSAFNVDSTGDGIRQLNTGGGATEGAKAQAVPNNTGGSIPGSGLNAQSADPGNRNQGPGAKPSADILQGERSGGGYSSNFASSDGGFSGYGNNGGGSGNSWSNSLKGFDLKKYLPGQEKDPAGRKIAAVADASKVKNGKFDCELFACLSRRMTAMCMQDRLTDCNLAAPKTSGDSL